jgi:dihydrofolate synthase/folylpolyglutamate synthase
MISGESNDAYRAAVAWLYELRWFGAKFGLENTFKLAKLAGNPQDKLRFIHVAGTNGKGSTCAMLESIYRAAGLRVGLFTSPHLVSFRERLQINRQLIGERDVVRLTERMRALTKEFPEGHHPTFFETVTVMALCHFAEQNCELVIWETGLGGRLDATNIVTPLASVITNVEYDHQQWLGETLTEIANEKAGIIKPGVPVITAADQPEALDAVRKRAEEQHAPLTEVCASTSPADTPAHLPLAGKHQLLNSDVATATVKALQLQIPVSKIAIEKGLETVDWPGRLQCIRGPARMLLLDGAHNVAGALAFADTLKDRFPTARLTLILGILQDKNCAGICRILAPLAERILAVPVQNERTADPLELEKVCRDANRNAEITSCASLAEALAVSLSDPFVAITGSLYLIGEAMEQLGLSPALSNERGLNEWSPAKTDASKSS